MSIAMVAALPLRHVRRGKVREVYDAGRDRLLLVATDRVSAFDVVMKETIPHKGAVLTQMTAWWLNQLGVDHHMISADADEIIAMVPELRSRRDMIVGRAMLCRRTDVFPVECVVRGYLSGSAWKEYKASGTLAGEKLPAGLQESSRFDPPIFSPATKAETGHDENITIRRMRETLGADDAATLESLSRKVYETGRSIAEKRGIIIADTKFEFGRDSQDRILLIDEVLTPDSSRFWPAESYAPGRSQPSFDKQPLRDYLDGERKQGKWNGEAPPPPLPSSVVARDEHSLSRRLPAHHRKGAEHPGACMNFAREGWSFIIGSFLIAAAVILTAAMRRSWPLWLLGFALLIIAVWVASFFRDPERTAAEKGERIVISPADGKVVLITEVDEPTFMKGRAKRVSVFMNVFNVHVNRYPVSGVVQYVQATPGKFMNAIAESASLENEQTSVGIEAGSNRILVRQIAGLIARRIHTYSRVGDQAKQGERMGMIRFGSRVDVFLPLDATLRVKVGDVAFAGVTVLGELKSK
jgi:phosphoribosylaminoimidazole-succinocarboxamide synthase